jgi:hypothetical protein
VRLLQEKADLSGVRQHPRPRSTSSPQGVRRGETPVEPVSVLPPGGSG